MHTTLRSRQAPPEWDFNDADFAKYSARGADGRGARFWRCPVRLVHGGRLRGLFRPVTRSPHGAKRGGGGVTSVLPVLAAHTFPEKRSSGLSDRDARWTRWSYLSRRKVAALAGVNKDTVTDAIKLLQAADLLEQREAPWYDNFHPPGAFEYRISGEFYPSQGETYAAIPLSLFYSGRWAMLRTPATRQVYLVIACLEPIHDEAAFPLTDGQIAAHGSRVAALDAIRDEHPMPTTVLARAAGVTRNTVTSALRELTLPRVGPATGQRLSAVRWNMTPEADAPRWYAINRDAPFEPWYSTALARVA
jgi:hypothetical protein